MQIFIDKSDKNNYMGHDPFINFHVMPKHVLKFPVALVPWVLGQSSNNISKEDIFV